MTGTRHWRQPQRLSRVGYTPNPGDSFVIVNNEGTQPLSGTFNGLPEGSLLVAGGRRLPNFLHGGADGNDVVLTCIAADVWTGLSTSDSNWSDGANWLSGFAPHAGDNLLFPAGAAQTSNVNDFDRDGTAFGLIEIAGDNYDLTGNPVLLAGNIVSGGTATASALEPATLRRRRHRQRQHDRRHLHRFRRHRSERPQPLGNRRERLGHDGA